MWKEKCEMQIQRREGLEFYDRGAAEFVDMIGALMQGCIDMEMMKAKCVSLKTKDARERHLQKVVGAVMWPLMT